MNNLNKSEVEEIGNQICMVSEKQIDVSCQKQSAALDITVTSALANEEGLCLVEEAAAKRDRCRIA